MLFCTTTSARRCSALTIAAFSCGSSIGSCARWTRRLTSPGSAPRCSLTSLSTWAASGSSATASTDRSGEQQVGVRGRVHVLGEGTHDAARILETVPARHLADQRASRRSAAPPHRAWRGDHPARVPSTRRNAGGPCATRRLDRPAVAGWRRPPRPQAPGSSARRHRSRAGTTQIRSGSSPVPGELPAREDVGVGRLRRTAAGTPSVLRQLVRRSRPT